MWLIVCDRGRPWTSSAEVATMKKISDQSSAPQKWLLWETTAWRLSPWMWCGEGGDVFSCPKPSLDACACHDLPVGTSGGYSLPKPWEVCWGDRPSLSPQEVCPSALGWGHGPRPWPLRAWLPGNSEAWPRHHVEVWPSRHVEAWTIHHGALVLCGGAGRPQPPAESGWVCAGPGGLLRCLLPRHWEGRLVSLGTTYPQPWAGRSRERPKLCLVHIFSTVGMCGARA